MSTAKLDVDDQPGRDAQLARMRRTVGTVGLHAILILVSLSMIIPFF